MTQDCSQQRRLNKIETDISYMKNDMIAIKERNARIDSWQDNVDEKLDNINNNIGEIKTVIYIPKQKITYGAAVFIISQIFLWAGAVFISNYFLNGGGSL